LLTWASLLIGYLLGSIPSAVWFGKLIGGIDVREHGSKNPGLTNTLRLLGWKAAAPVAVFDLGKGILAPIVARHLAPEVEWLPAAAGGLAILGHSFTCFAGFRGGKGVLTALGIFLALAWPEALGAFAIWSLITWRTRYVSLASIVASAGLAVALSIHALLRPELLEPRILAIAGTAVALFVAVKHRANIARLRAGTENRWGDRVKVQPATEPQPSSDGQTSATSSTPSSETNP